MSNTDDQFSVNQPDSLVLCTSRYYISESDIVCGTLTFFPPLLCVLWQAWNSFWENDRKKKSLTLSRGPAIWSKSALQRLTRTWQRDAMSSQNHSAPFRGSGWYRLFSQVRSAAPGLRICLTHTLCLKNVLHCASCHKPHYVSVKCEVSRGVGSVPGWCVLVGGGVAGVENILLKISSMNSSEDINTAQ